MSPLQRKIIIRFAFGIIILLAIVVILNVTSSHAKGADAYITDADNWQWHYDTGAKSILTKVVRASGAVTEVNFPTDATWFGATGSHLTTIGANCFADTEGRKATKILSMTTTITTINTQAFYQCTLLTSVSIGSGVTTISANCFYQCTGLLTITIPDSVTSLGASSFYLCSAMTWTKIGNSTDKIDTSTFSGCNKLVWAYLGTGITSIGAQAFKSDVKLASIIIPNSVVWIGANAFDGDTVLVSITIGNGCLYLKDYSFANCPAITSFTSKNIITVGNYSFSSDTGLTTITINNSCTSIGDNCFYGCTKVTSVSLGTGLITIGSNAFILNSLLTTIDIPSNVVTIKSGAFSTCAVLATVTFHSGSLITIGSGAFATCPKITSITMPNSVTTLGSGAFQGATVLATLSISNNITTIFDNTFYTCSALTSITIPNSVKYICTGAFYQCSNVVTLTMSSNIISINSSAFKNCYKIQSVTLPNSCTAIRDSAFYQCSALATFNTGTGLLTIETNAFFATTFTTINLRNVTTIGTYAFSTSGLTSITIPNTLSIIQDYCFQNSYNLVYVTLGSGVTLIKQYAFDHCYSIMTLNIPNQVTTIGNYAFASCTHLYSVDLGTGLTSLGSSAFQLDVLLASITFPNSLTATGIMSFYGCTALHEVIWGTGIITIDQYTFYLDTALTSISLPNQITTIANNAFQGCSYITVLTFGTGTSILGNSLFADCTRLANINFLGLVKPTVGTAWLTNVPLAVRGHAYQTSNFPTTGNVFPTGKSQGADGLMMGTYLGIWCPTFTSSPITGGTIGIAYSYSLTINETGTVTAIAIPSWLSLSHNGTSTSPWVLSGTPSQSGIYNAKIKALSTLGTLYGYQNFTISVVGTWSATFTSSPLIHATKGYAYSYTITLNESATTTAITLPWWLSLTHNGTSTSPWVLSGNPVASGLYSVHIKALSTNGCLYSYQNFSIGVNDTWQSQFTSFPLISTEINLPYSYHITTNESSIIKLNCYVSWLSITHNNTIGTHYLNGTPSVIAIYNVFISAYSVKGLLWSYQNYSINVTPYVPSGSTTWVTQFTSFPALSIINGSFYSYQITTNESANISLMYSVSWLSMSNNNTIGTHYLNGTPSMVATYSIHISAQSLAGKLFSYQNFSIDVEPIPPSLWKSTFLSIPLIVSNNNTNYTYEVFTNETSILKLIYAPSWLTFSNDNMVGTHFLNGTSNQTGMYNISIASYSVLGTLWGYQNYTLNITNPSGFHLSFTSMIIIIWLGLGIVFSALGLRHGKLSVIAGFIWASAGVTVFLPISNILGIVILGLGFMFMIYGLASFFKK